MCDCNYQDLIFCDRVNDVVREANESERSRTSQMLSPTSRIISNLILSITKSVLEIISDALISFQIPIKTIPELH
jgi:hypothetical protein